MYSLVTSCLLVSLAATVRSPQRHAACAFTPPQRGAVSRPSPGGSSSSSEDSSAKKRLGVSVAPLDVTLDDAPTSNVRNAPLTDEDIELELQNHLVRIRQRSEDRGRRRASEASKKKKRKPRIVGGGGSGQGGAGGVEAIRVVGAPQPPSSRRRRQPVSVSSEGKNSFASSQQRLTREEEAQISSAIRSLCFAVRVRDDLAVTMGREPTEREWADAFSSSQGKVRAAGSDGGRSEIAEVLDLRRVMRLGREARSRLVAANAGLVANLARKYASSIRLGGSNGGGGRGGVGSILTAQDLIQEGNLGLMEAAERFEPERGFRFSTYATHWVRQRMLRSIADTSRVIRLPAHVHSKLGTIRRARQDLEKDLGRPPTDDELSDHLDLPVDKIRLYAGSALNVLSLESPVGSPSSRSLDDRRRALGDVIASHAPTPEEDALSRSFRGEVRAAVEGCLSDRERDVLVLRFGLEDGTPRSVGDTARELGLSRDRVRTVEAKALNKLRHPRRNRGLMEYVNGGGGGSGEDRYGQMDDEEMVAGPAAAGGAGAVDYVVGSSPESLWSF